jgi:nucleoside 2-deoxyribosyltransferase
MKNVFLSVSFSHIINADTGKVLPEFRQKVEQILHSLRTEAHVKVYCDMEDEKWHMPGGLPERGVSKDMSTLDNADLLLALVEEHPSVGVEFEMGYMVAKSRPVILAMQAGNKLAFFNQGLVSAGLVTLITYDDASSLAQQLAIAVNAPDEAIATTTGPA